MTAENRYGTARHGRMMYDENCFERWSDDMERNYLSWKDEESEKPKCSGYDCDSEAVIQIGKDWYCAECALQVEDILTNK